MKVLGKCIVIICSNKATTVHWAVRSFPKLNHKCFAHTRWLCTKIRVNS